jgi:hypothetical protein
MAARAIMKKIWPRYWVMERLPGRSQRDVVIMPLLPCSAGTGAL